MSQKQEQSGAKDPEETEEDSLLKMNKLNSDSDKVELIADNFRLLCQDVLPAFKNSEFNPERFSGILPKVTSVFATCVDDLIRSSGDVEYLDREQSLNALIVMSDCLQVCASRVPPNTSANSVSDLIETVLNTALNTFCLYSNFGVGHESADHSSSKQFLDPHFNNAIALTKAFVTLWEKQLKVDVAFEDDVQLVLKVCDRLNDICEAFEAITGKPAVSIWKCYTSILLKYCDKIQDRVDVARVINYLCRVIGGILTDIDKQGAEDIAKSAQLCGFFCKILKTICDRFKHYLGDCFVALTQLILTLYGKSVMKRNSRETTAVLSEIEKHVTIVGEPLTLQLLNETKFLDVLTDRDYEIDGDRAFQMCLLLLFVMQNLHNIDEKQQDFLLDSSQKSHSKISVLDKLFDTFAKCSLEFSLPITLKGVMCRGRPEKLVSFYEYACVKVSAALTVLPARHFPHLERTLLRNLISGTMWQALLACDAWSYLGRLESPKLCYQHFRVLASIVDRLHPILFTADSTVYVRLLCRRLFNFLAIEDKFNFVTDLPVDRHPGVWLCILPCVSGELLEKLDGGRQRLITQNIQVLEEALKGGSGSTSSSDVLQRIYCSLAFLNGVHSNDLPNSLKLRLQKCVSSLWSAIDASSVPPPPPGSNAELIICALIPLLGQLVCWSTNSILMQMLPKMVRLQQVGSEAIKLSVSTKFMRRLGEKRIAASVDQPEILRCICALLTGSDADESALVLHHSLEAFSTFSHQTPHSNIISQCFVQRTDFKDIVIRFLKQIPIRSAANYDYETLIRNQCKHSETISEFKPVPICQSLDSKESKAENEEKLYRAAVQRICEDVNQLRDLLRSETENPKWLSAELDVILRELITVRNTLE